MQTTTASLPEGSIRLRDGRRLAYAEYGDPLGKPIFFFHGTPGSRLFHHPDVSVAAYTGARVIAVDRPGFGCSDFKPGRTLLDWPNDVVQLADALNIQRFAVMGYSGGGPYAAVCASSIPDRLTAAGLVSSTSPLDNPQITRGMQGMGHMYFRVGRYVPPLARLCCQLMCANWRRNPDLYFKSQVNGLRNFPDAEALLPKMKAMLKADFLEAVRAGTEGITWDLEILARPWGFHLHVIAADVLLWHGESDTQAPLAMGKRLSSAIPHCRPTFFPGEGHWAIYKHWQEILTALVQSEPATRKDLQPATISVGVQANDPGAQTVIPDTIMADLSPKSSQGLQPARDVADTPASVAREPEPAQGIVPVSKKSTKRRTPATADESAGASPKPELAQGIVPVSKKSTGRQPEPAQGIVPVSKKSIGRQPEPAQGTVPVSKKSATRRTTAAEITPALVSPEPPKPVSKKIVGRRTTAVADSPAEDSDRPEPAPEKAKSAGGRTSKRSAAAAANARSDDSSEPKPMPDKAKATAKRPAKPTAAAVEPLDIGAPQGPDPAQKAAEPAAKKTSSGRKAAKEAVLV